MHTHHCWLHGETALRKSSCCTCNLNNSPERCSLSSPFLVNQPTGARQVTQGVPAAAELGEMKVVLIPPARARQPGRVRSKRRAAGSAKVAPASDSSASCYHHVTGLGQRRGPHQHHGVAPKAAEGASAWQHTPLLVQTAGFPRERRRGQPGTATRRWAKPRGASTSLPETCCLLTPAALAQHSSHVLCPLSLLCPSC